MKTLFGAVFLASLSIHCGAKAITIQDVFADMDPKASSEAMVKKIRYDWQLHPMVSMYKPSGTVLPPEPYWTGTRPAWCYSALTWFVAFEGADNQATNTRIEIKNLRFFIYSEDRRQWERFDIQQRPGFDVWKDPFNLAGGETGARNEPDGGVSMKPVWGSEGKFFHGYGNPVKIVPTDVRATFVAMDFRLIVDDASLPDDRDRAVYVLDVGGDYYPGNGQPGWGVPYAPAMGNGRMLKPTKEWRTATMIVLNKDAKDAATMQEEIKLKPPPFDNLTVP